MNLRVNVRKLTLVALALSSLLLGAAASAADIKGQVLGGGAPIAQSTVILMQASAGEPKQLAQTKSDSNGNFAIHGAGAPGSSLYLIASGGVPSANKAGGNNRGNPAVDGSGQQAPAKVVINEMTTIASVVTHAQFIVGTWIKGSPLALKIAADNVPNFVDLQTGGYGPTILDALNSAQTPTMANFATLSSIVAGCVTRVKADACSRLYAAATPPNGGPPVDTLSSIESIVYTPWHQPDKIFALLNDFYPVPTGQDHAAYALHAVPDVRSECVDFPAQVHWRRLQRCRASSCSTARAMPWVGDNFLVGAQNQDALWDGNLTKFAPNGKPLSPSPSGFTGGGVEGIGFGLAIDAHDNVWGTTYGTKAIVKFDKTGKPLSPPDGYNFGGQLGQMQGIIVTPSGDVWAARRREGPGHLHAAGRSRQGPVLLPEQDRRSTEEPVQAARSLPSRDRPAGPHLDLEHPQRQCHPFPCLRSEQA